ncbi:hypothetical protein BC939DRAFT_46950 [Gamsiella multidivaricata]|uniref:uncharacterized protein n=1 Tax=Gamsiella multidivaricata TaxID=101098 RepID=UPI00222038CE|nr:uncharacterized protein BC939DRAFT_46950 [Gamsiella multidivaricata]KAI7816357.1 hypothetical protein BC939DRAFT_46950 [Gamsiella multidivaricata]
MHKRIPIRLVSDHGAIQPQLRGSRWRERTPLCDTAGSWAANSGTHGVGLTHTHTQLCNRNLHTDPDPIRLLLSISLDNKETFSRLTHYLVLYYAVYVVVFPPSVTVLISSPLLFLCICCIFLFQAVCRSLLAVLFFPGLVSDACPPWAAPSTLWLLRETGGTDAVFGTRRRDLDANKRSKCDSLKPNQ